MLEDDRTPEQLVQLDLRFADCLKESFKKFLLQVQKGEIPDSSDGRKMLWQLVRKRTPKGIRLNSVKKAGEWVECDARRPLVKAVFEYAYNDMITNPNIGIVTAVSNLVVIIENFVNVIAEKAGCGQLTQTYKEGHNPTLENSVKLEVI